MNIYSIVTHNARSNEAAEAWNRDGVCAIGWTNVFRGDIRKVKKETLAKDRSFASATKLFLGIQKGDLLLAYARNNMISYVGKVEGGYQYNVDNEVGRANGFNYPNQLKVNWWPEPHHFDRKDLPPWLGSQLGKIGKTITKIETDEYGIEKTLEIIKTCPVSGKPMDQIEDLVKAGLRKYMHRIIDALETGLRLSEAEPQISESDRPDFLALDKNDRIVIIECKGTAKRRDCEQLERYGMTLKSKKPRLMLIAFDFEPACTKEAREKKLELVECELLFKKRGTR